MHVELVPRLRDFDVSAGTEMSFAVADFPHHARALVDPIDEAIAAEIDYRIAARLSCRARVFAMTSWQSCSTKR